MREFSGNVYEDAQRAAAYATLEFPGTYFLAFRDLPDLIRAHVAGTRALDFGCGAGLGEFDLILAAFTFDNVPTRSLKVQLLSGLGAALRPGGRLIHLVSAAEIYRHEWASFSTRDFPENLAARDGDLVRIVMLDVPDRRPVEDVLCTEASWQAIHCEAGLAPLQIHRPLGRADEPYAWVAETQVAPWAITVLGRRDGEPVGAPILPS